MTEIGQDGDSPLTKKDKATRWLISYFFIFSSRVVPQLCEENGEKHLAVNSFEKLKPTSSRFLPRSSWPEDLGTKVRTVCPL